MKIFLSILGIFSILATLLPFIKLDYWWIRIFDYPRFQIVVLTLLSLTSFLFFSRSTVADYVLIGALVICSLYQIFVILPYTTVYTKQVKSTQNEMDGKVFSLVVANVLMDNKNVEGFLKIVNDCNPDIVLAVETNGWWQKQLKSLEGSHPFLVHYPLENTYGMLLYSKFELIDPKVNFLVEDDIPSIFVQFKLPSGQVVDLHCLHPTPPVPTQNPRSTEREAELLMVGKTAKKSKNPVVVVGDLNDVAWSYTTKLFQSISGLLDPRVGRGLFSTFHAEYKLFRWPLDHVFHSEHFKVLHLKRLPYFGSDHFPMYIKLQYEPAAKAEQKQPEAEPEEKQEAQEKIEKV